MVLWARMPQEGLGPTEDILRRRHLVWLPLARARRPPAAEPEHPVGVVPLATIQMGFCSTSPAEVAEAEAEVAEEAVPSSCSPAATLQLIQELPSARMAEAVAMAPPEPRMPLSVSKAAAVVVAPVAARAGTSSCKAAQ